MKIAIGYPPLESPKGIPLLSQNRQFQWFPNLLTAYYIYPVVPASAATLLSQNGHEVFWLDGIAKNRSYQQWLGELKRIKPDLLMIETKTPVVKQHWEIVSSIKYQVSSIKIVLVGDHVTALPEESMENSTVDYILTGGDYDFLILNLINHLTNGEKLETGIYYREGKKIKNTGRFQLNHDLNKLPIIDRDLTHWQDYAYKNSVFFRTPGTYTMFGRDCWWGKCSFCSWVTLYPGNCYRVRDVSLALKEAESLVKLGVREIMDDSGTFPVGKWLKNFCQGMINLGLNQKVRINCNMRFHSGLSQDDYNLMAKAGFRFILYGLESASQETLDRINKNLKVEQIEENLRMAKKAGLWPHVTVMVGYPWEEKEDIEKTINFVQSLFKKGLVDTMQATIVIPYPGTPLFQECQKSGLLKTKDWDRYDMREPIMKTKVPEKYIIATTAKLFSVSIWNPQFILRALTMLFSFDGLKYFSLQVLKYFAKLWEFR
ncbi:radical SAM protein [Candidatus Gottesmanbacteria bacterium]|nr:radical SAM protein [Candidatus Gottesmanbacteria bacterium]